MVIFLVDDVEFLNKDKFICIKDFRIDKDRTFYIIEVAVGSCTWTLERRYSDFLEFDRLRFKHLKQSFLPPKKFLGNQDVDFIKRRRSDLERYLRTVFELEVLLQKKRQHSSLPRHLARFLDFHKYEVLSICEELASDLSHNGEKILSPSNRDYYEMSPLHLHAISERLKLSVPTCESNISALDFGHVLDFAHRLENLKIKGLKRSLENSNVVPNERPFSLNPFKNLKSLWIIDCDQSTIYGITSCRKTVAQLTVHNSIRFISDVAIDKDSFHFTNDEQSRIWAQIRNIDLSFNNINFIDESVILLKTVQKLNLTCNRLIGIEYLHHLTHLTELNLSHNMIESVDQWHQKLGNLKRLILTANRISCLEGLRKMYSLEYLDLRDNRIVQTADVWPLGGLPCLLVVLLNGNPLEASVEYRSRVLEAFGDRAAEVKLDNDSTTQRELDTVGVRLAIRKAREDRERQLKIARDQISRALNFGTKPNEGSSFGNSSSLSGRSTNTSESYASDNENPA